MKKEDPKINNASEKIFWLLVFLVLPLRSFNFLLDHDGIPKLIFISILTLFLLGVIWKTSKIIKLDKPTTLLLLFVFLFLAWSAVSIHTSINITEGITNWFSLFIIFLFLVVLIYSGFNQKEIIFRFVPISVFLLVSVLIYQIILNLIKNDGLKIDHTLCSTLSNKNFLSESLILLLPFTIAGALTCIGKIKKLNVAAFCIIIPCLIILQTLSAWLCILFFLFVCAPAYWFLFSKKDFLKNKLRPRKVILIVAGCLLIASLLIKWLDSNNAFEPLHNKFSSIEKYFTTDFSELMKEDSKSNINSVFERLFLWRNTTLLAKENLLTGIGISNWRILWPKYGVGGAYFLSAGVMHYEHPHNEYLLFFSELGLWGLILFLLIFATTFYIAISSFRNAQNENERKIIFLLSAGIFSFLILSFFGYPFHRPFTSIVLMVTVALISSSGIKSLPQSRKPLWIKFSLSICIVLCLYSLKVFSSRWEGEYNMNAAFNEQAHGRFPKMYSYINKAENDYFKIDLMGTPLDWYRGFALNYMGSDSSLYYFRKAESQNPYHIQILSDIGATLENKGQHEEAIRYLKRALTIIPGYKEAHYNLAIANYNLGKHEESLKEINQAYMVGYPYQRTLEAILILNADSLIQQTPNVALKDCFNKYANDKKALKRINELSMMHKVSFLSMLKDSCENSR